MHGRQRPQPSNTNHPNPFQAEMPTKKSGVGGHFPPVYREKGLHARLENDSQEPWFFDPLSRQVCFRTLLFTLYAWNVIRMTLRSAMSEKRLRRSIARGFHLFPFRTEKLNPGTGTVPGRFVFAPGRGEQPGGSRVMGGAEGGGVSEISEESALLESHQRHHHYRR